MHFWVHKDYESLDLVLSHVWSLSLLSACLLYPNKPVQKQHGFPSLALLWDHSDICHPLTSPILTPLLSRSSVSLLALKYSNFFSSLFFSGHSILDSVAFQTFLLTLVILHTLFQGKCPHAWTVAPSRGFHHAVSQSFNCDLHWSSEVVCLHLYLGTSKV